MGLDINAIVTERILAKLSEGIIPWQRPWHGVRSGAYGRSTGKPYSLLNQMMLEPGEYATYNEILKAGGNVKKGEKANIVVFWKPYMVEDPNEPTKKKTIPLLRYFNVFNVETQCEGIEKKYKDDLISTLKPDEKAEKIIESYISGGPTLELVASNQAYYAPLMDKVVAPLLEQFEGISEYYSTLFHELVHSTGHQSRLNRLGEKAAFGSEVYSKEELVAEMGACALVGYCGLESESSFRNNAAYIQSWMKAIKDDKHLLVGAAGKAEKAVSLILEGFEKEEKGAVS